MISGTSEPGDVAGSIVQDRGYTHPPWAIIRSPRAMLTVGARLAQHTRPGSIYHLSGDLAAGKTTLVRGFLQGLGHRGPVKSPTFTYVEPYALADLTVYHFDLYRIGGAEELEALGVRDYFDGRAICLIEWAERGAEILPPPDVRILLQPHEQPHARRMYVEVVSPAGMALVAGV